MREKNSQFLSCQKIKEIRDFLDLHFIVMELKNKNKNGLGSWTFKTQSFLCYSTSKHFLSYAKWLHNVKRKNFFVEI